MDEPIIRCDGCGKLLSVVSVRKLGCCRECGNRRFKSVSMLSEEEEKSLRDGTYDFGPSGWPLNVDEFLALFEGMEEV